MTLITRGRVVSLSNQTAFPPLTVETHGATAQGRVVAENLTRAAQLAERIVAEAEAKVATRLEQLERDTARIHGEIRAQALADVELEQVRKTLELATLRQRIVAGAEQDIVAIAQLLAERILSEELTLRPERLVELARGLLREARGARIITVYASPQDAKYLSGEIQQAATDANACINVLPDELLGPGDLRIETDVGSIDARLGTQLTHLASAILEWIRT